MTPFNHQRRMDISSARYSAHEHLRRMRRTPPPPLLFELRMDGQWSFGDAMQALYDGVVAVSSLPLDFDKRTEPRRLPMAATYADFISAKLNILSRTSHD